MFRDELAVNARRIFCWHEKGGSGLQRFFVVLLLSINLFYIGNFLVNFEAMLVEFWWLPIFIISLAVAVVVVRKKNKDEDEARPGWYTYLPITLLVSSVFSIFFYLFQFILTTLM